MSSFHIISLSIISSFLFLFYPLDLSLVEFVAMSSPISPIGYVSIYFVLDLSLRVVVSSVWSWCLILLWLLCLFAFVIDIFTTTNITLYVYSWKYTFKINAVKYHHRGSTCDPAGILILVLLTSHTQSFYDEYVVYFKIVWISIFGNQNK